MDVKSLDIDRKLLVVGVLDEMRRLRQIAYENSLEMPELLPAYKSAEALYRETASAFQANYIPLFDRQAHIAERITKGDEAFTVAYGNRPRV